MSPRIALPRILLLTLCALATATAQDPPTLETVVSNPKIWPHRITVTAPLQIPTAAQGQPSAPAIIPAGSTLSVKEIKPTGVLVDFNGTDVLISADQTDLLTRAGTIAGQIGALPPASSVSRAEAVLRSAIAASSKAASGPISSVSNQVAKSLDGDLVSLEGGKLQEFDASDLVSNKYLAIYYSAHWCPPCRAFTPQLVNWYNDVKTRHPDFDIIFYSADRSEADMLEYMRTDRMPWPAMAYKNTQLRNDLGSYAGPGIPDLVVLDQNGRVVSDSYQGGNYVGPQKVLQDLTRLLDGS